MTDVDAEERIFIYGASGYGLGIAHSFLAGFEGRALCSVAGFVDDFSGGEGACFEGFPVYSFEQWRQRKTDASMVVGISAPRDRRRLVQKVTEAGGRFEHLHRNLGGTTFPRVAFGRSNVLGAPLYIGPLTSIGDHTHIDPLCSIGHDVEIGDYCTICPTSAISGYVVIESDVFLGAGTIVVNGKRGNPLVIGRGVHAAAGSVITRSVPPGARIAGNPARALRDLVRERRGHR